MRVTTMTAAIMTAALAGCAPNPPENPMDAPSYEAATVALDSSEVARARVRLTQLDTGVRLAVDAFGLSAGVHGVHVHAVGLCQAPRFESAGPHWNPSDRQHGADNPAGQHMGDLPNIEIGEDGTGRLEVLIPGARLIGGDMPLIDADGVAVVIHASADDYRTDPSGNSGGRIACGVVVAGEPDD